MTLIDTLEYATFRSALGALRLLPYRWSERLLRGAARLVGPVGGLRRDVVSQQLAAALPELGDRERAALVGLVYDHLGRTAAEVFCAESAGLQSRVRVEPGWETLDRALAGGRGAIAATAHLGNFELGGRVLAARYRLLDVVKPQRNRSFDRYLQDQRHRHGIATVPMDRAGLAVLRHLRSGGLVSLLVDQDAGAAGVRLDFLGRPASVWPGAARIALKTGCPVVPMAILREDRGHVLRVGEVITVRPGPSDPAAVASLMARISDAVAAFILDQPAQWFWVHRRWKGAREAGAVPRPGTQ